MARPKLTKRPVIPVKDAGVSFCQSNYFYKYLIFLFAFFLFANSIFNGYNLDDELVTIGQRLTSKGISAIPEIFASPYYQDVSGYSYEYRPAVLVSFAIEHEFFGDNAHVSHFLNILLYAISCLLLYLVLIKLFREYSPFLALAASFLFAAHTAHTEVVCSIKNRDEILGLMFSLLSFYLILLCTQPSRRWLLLLVPVFYMLALMSKITVVSFVVLIPIAVILFTEAQFALVIGITALLLVPTFFLLNFGMGQDKDLMILSVLLFTAMFYWAIHFKSALTKAKNSLNKIYHILFPRALTAPPPPENPSTTFLDLFNGTIPEQTIFSLQALLIPSMLALLYFLCLYEKQSLIAIFPAILLLVLAWMGQRKISWWANAMLALCLSLNILFIPAANVNTLYSVALETYFGFLIIVGARDLFIPSLLSFFLFNFLSISIFHKCENIGAIIFIYFLYSGYWYVILFLFLVTSLGAMYQSLLHKGITLAELLSFIFYIATGYSIRSKIKTRTLLLISAIFAILISHCYLAPYDHPVQIAKNLSRVAEIANKTNPEILPQHEYRPLDFIEECINLNSPQTVKIGTALEITWHYLCKVILPYPLAFYYGYKFIVPQKITDPVPLLSLFIHVLLIIIAFALIKRNKLISFGLFTYLISIAVFSNYLGAVPGMFADRFLLIPSIGWVIILAATLQWAFKISKEARWDTIPKPPKYAFFIILLFYSSLSFARNFDWKDYLTLFEHDISYVDECAQAHNLLGIRLIKTSFQDNTPPVLQAELRNKAAFHFHRAIDIYPPFFNATYDLGRTYSLLGKNDSAIYFFKKTLAIRPQFTDASVAIGDILASQNKLSEAEPYYEYLIKISPRNLSGYDKLSYIYFVEKDFHRSTGILSAAISAMPQNPQPYIDLAKIYHNIKRDDSSSILLRAALVLNPGNEEALKYLHALGQ